MTGVDAKRRRFAFDHFISKEVVADIAIHVHGDGNPHAHIYITTRRLLGNHFDRYKANDLKHTFGRRLRAVGVSFEDRQDLLGHKSSRITTHYSTAELYNLWHAANSVCQQSQRSQAVNLLRVNPIVPQISRKVGVSETG